MSKDKKEKKKSKKDEDGDISVAVAEGAEESVCLSYVCGQVWALIFFCYEVTQEGEESEKGEGRRRDNHQAGRSITFSKASGTEEDVEKDAQSHKERLVNRYKVCYAFTHTAFLTASKSRQVKRGVKEVVKGIRKGEKG